MSVARRSAPATAATAVMAVRHTIAAALRAPLAVLAVLAAAEATAGAQAPTRAAVAVDSTSARCLDVGWLDARASCEGRSLNAASLSIAGASVGAAAGLLGGAIAPTACLGGAEQNALRGAIAGAALGATVGLLTRHVSRRERAARAERDRASARSDAPHPWSWRDVRPAVITLGTVAATGAVIGGVQGSRYASRCNGVAPGTATGAGVYATSGATAMVGSLLIVRFLF